MSILDDTDYIGARAKLLHAFDRGICMNRATGTSAGCWCMKAAPDGSNLKCPPEDRSPVVTDAPARGPMFKDLPSPWFARRRT